MKTTLAAIPSLFVYLFITSSLLAQSISGDTPVTYDNWFQSRLDALESNLNNANSQKLVIANGKGTDRQASTPSVDSRSTSLVDQSSASDLFSAAINLVPQSSVLGSTTSGGTSTASSGSSGSGSVSATLYAIMASAHGYSVTDASYYRAHPSARKLSFTAGSSASSQATDNTTAAAATLGVKFLILNDREIFIRRNSRLVADAQLQAGQLGQIRAQTLDAAKALIAQTLCPGIENALSRPKCILSADDRANFTVTVLPRLPSDFQTKIDALIAAKLRDADVGMQTLLDSDYDQISTAPQVSVAYSTDLRSGVGYSHHRGAFIVDWGHSKRPFGYTVNASSEFIDRKGVAANSTGGRFGFEGQYQAIRSGPTSTRSSLTLSLSGEGDWLTKQKPQYKGQIKAEIPLMSGLSLPVAYTYENHAAQLNQSNSEAKLGLSIDFAKVIQGMKANNK